MSNCSDHMFPVGGAASDRKAADLAALLSTSAGECQSTGVVQRLITALHVAIYVLYFALSVPVLEFAARPQELVGFLSEAADLSPTDGSLEVCEQDLEEIYTVIVEDDQQPPESPEAAGGNPAQPALSTPE